MQQKQSILLNAFWLLLIVCLAVFNTVFIYAGLVDYLEGPLRDQLTTFDYAKFSVTYTALGIITGCFICCRSNIHSATIIIILFILDLVVLIAFYPWQYGYTQLLPHLLVGICNCLGIIFFAFYKYLWKQ